MPYHLAEVYQAAQLAEFAAGAALLFSLAFTKRLCDDGGGRNLVGLAASYALLILSHLPLAMFGSLVLLVYALLNIPKGRVRSTIPKLTTAVLLALAASSFYWTTMVAEMKWIVANGVNPDPMLDYRRNFVFSTFSPEKNETIWWMSLLAIATIMMLSPGVVILRRKFSAPSKRALLAIVVLVAFSLIMSTQISKPVWAAIPFLPMTLAGGDVGSRANPDGGERPVLGRASSPSTPRSSARDGRPGFDRHHLFHLTDGARR
jgi:hypothetical protein